MTRKDKVREVRPEAVNSAYMGDVFSCPADYKFLELPKVRFPLCNMECARCWNVEWNEPIRLPGYCFTKERWIPVENGYPKERGYYLLSFHGHNKAHFGRYEIDKEGNGAFYFIQDGSRPCVGYNMFVSAWMEIPEAYKEDER